MFDRSKDVPPTNGGTYKTVMHKTTQNNENTFQENLRANTVFMLSSTANTLEHRLIMPHFSTILGQKAH